MPPNISQSNITVTWNPPECVGTLEIEEIEGTDGYVPPGDGTLDQLDDTHWRYTAFDEPPTELCPKDAKAWIAAFNAVGLGGHSDWRVPTTKELHSLIDYSTNTPAVSAGFPGEVAASSYWSSTPSVGAATFAWLVDFDFGSVNGGFKTSNFRVRAVRGGP